MPSLQDLPSSKASIHVGGAFSWGLKRGREGGALYYSFPPLPLVAAAFESGGKGRAEAWEGFRKENMVHQRQGKAAE